jgi:diaminopimelate epimerase
MPRPENEHEENLTEGEASMDLDIQQLMETLPEHVSLFEGCGNMLGIVPLSLAGFPVGWDFQKSPEMRRFLANWGKQINSDSVMVLTGDPRQRDAQGYHVMMYVFEPNGSDDTGMAGGVSTMCGNGVRAVAAYIRELDPEAENAQIMTMSGLRNIEFDGDFYAVDMGTMTNNAHDLAQYVDASQVQPNESGEYYRSPIPAEIVAHLSQFTSAREWSIGLTGTYTEDGSIDGEPHIVVEIPADQARTIEELREIAVVAGPIITKNLNLFPKEINVNFIVRQGLTDEAEPRAEVMNCTHERNLGEDADHSVTAACGTGSTVVGGVTLRGMEEAPVRAVLVHCTGGDLEISGIPTDLVMKGPAVRVE